MKVTVDTRHDSLDGALATVRAAFGASGDSFDRGDRNETPTVARANVSGANGAGPAGRVSATPVAKRTPAKQTTRAARRSGRTPTEPNGSVKATSTIAPAGRAEAIRSWAKSQGMGVKQAGRLPAAVIQAYQKSFQS
jgi:hypothetical protein